MRRHALAILVLSAGCGTLYNLEYDGPPSACHGPNHPVPMGGMITDVMFMAMIPPLIPFGLVDLPLSLVGDLVTLPFTRSHETTSTPEPDGTAWAAQIPLDVTGIVSATSGDRIVFRYRSEGRSCCFQVTLDAPDDRGARRFLLERLRGEDYSGLRAELALFGAREEDSVALVERVSGLAVHIPDDVAVAGELLVERDSWNRYRLDLDGPTPASVFLFWNPTMEQGTILRCTYGEGALGSRFAALFH